MKILALETSARAVSAANASPLAAATPMRMPVKEPGPAATAMASIWDTVSSVFFRIPYTMGISVRL